MSPQNSLHTKLAALLPELERHLETSAQAPHFGLLRNLLGKQRLLILPSVKNHHEITLPSRSPDDAPRARATVIVEITLLDAESAEQLSSRWVGQAEDAPMIATERAITRAMEDFLQKTFLVLDPATARQESLPEPPSRIRRQPQGSLPQTPQAVVPEPSTPALTTPPDQVAPAATSAPLSRDHVEDATQLDLLSLDTTRAANEDTPSQPLPPLTEAWKTSNALWRALVNEVASHEVMDAFEDAIERQHDADSWRRISPEQIRQVCHQLRKRSATSSDVRLLSDREEYILSQLPFIPEGSSLNRLDQELRRLSDAVVPEQTTHAFLSLYLEKMNASTLSEVPGKAAIALVRKMRRLKDEERAEFIEHALDQSTPQDSSAA